MNCGELERFLHAKRGKNSWQSFGKHGFAGVRRTNQDHVMTTCSSDFESPFYIRLSADIGEVGCVIINILLKFGTGIDQRRLEPTPPIEKGDDFRKIFDPIYLQFADNSGLARIPFGEYNSFITLFFSLNGDGESTPDRLNATIERKFAENKVVGKLVNLQLSGSAQDGDRYCQIVG